MSGPPVGRQARDIPTSVPRGTEVGKDDGPAMTFAGGDFAGGTEPATVDVDSRTITGLAVPYNKVARKYGMAFRFLPGSLEYDANNLGRIKHLKDHWTPVGVHTAVKETSRGPVVRLKVLDGPEGSPAKVERDQLLYDAQHGLYDGLSIGVDFSLDPEVGDVEWNEKDKVYDVKRAIWRETSSTPMPAFDDARVTKVRASKGGADMPEEHNHNQGGQTATETPEAPQTFTADEMAALRLLAQQRPDDGRQPVDPTARPLPSQPQDPYAQFGYRADGPPSLMPSQEGVVELARAVAERRAVRVAAETFATVSTTQTGKPRTYLGGRAGMTPLRIAELVGLPSENVGWGGEAVYPIFGAGAAGQANEGTAKQEYAAVTPGTATPKTIAVWTDMTAQAQSIGNFESKLRNKLARLVAIQENELLRATVAGTAGINAQSFTAGDQSVQILRAAAGIEATNGVRPDLMLFNPADTATVFGTSVANAAPHEIAELSVKVFGMIGLPMSTQPAGFVLVGAWAAAARLVVGLGLTYMVDPYTQMKSNIVTVLAEEAVTLAVEEPTAFTNVDIVTP